MKINVLSLEDLTENQTDVVVDADLPEEEIENLRANAQAQEEKQAAEEANAEEQTESQSLIDQVVALEALYEKIGSISEFPIELAMEAYDAAPDAYIMDTYRSGASTGAKISVALEGIMAKAWEGIKRFWAHLVTIWRKVIQYVDRFVKGGTTSDLVVNHALVTKLEAILHEAQQRWQNDQHKGLLVRNSPEEDTRLISAYHLAGSGKAAAALTRMKPIVPKCGQFIQITEKYLRELGHWGSEAVKHPDAQTTMPASPESTMHDFVEACEEVAKGFNLTSVTGRDSGAKRVPVAAIFNEIKATVINTEYGIERSLSSTMYDIGQFVYRREEEIKKIFDKGGVDPHEARVYRALGQELASLKQVCLTVFMLFPNAKTAQVHVLNVGCAWLKALSDSYGNMAKGGAHYSEEDVKFFKEEETAFKQLHDAYSKLLRGKNMLLGHWSLQV
jgi:hypothetical protein